jgi:antitoxin MazE
MARRNKNGDYSYTRTARVAGETERVAVIQLDHEHSRVARRRPDGTAEGDGWLVPSAEVVDVKPTHIVLTGQRGVVTLPQEVRRDLGLDEGRPLELVVEEDGRITIRPLSRIGPSPAVELRSLLAQMTPENLHDEVSTGGAVGREVW